MTPFQIVQDEWMQIAPLGNHAHAQGLQRVDAVCVAQMANRFNSFRARIGRMFAGVPVFEGHHDSDPEKYPNGRSFGWVTELQDRGLEGLWARVKWSDEGRRLVKSGQYKFVSPLWTGREIARENGKIVYRPDQLLSLALTNLPNLPLPPLANEKPNFENMKKLTEILELKEEASADEICAAAETLANARSAASQRAQGLADELAAERKKVEEERAERIELILANAVLAGRITLAKKNRWREELQKDLNWAEKALANAETELNRVSQTAELGNEKTAYDTEATRRNFLNAFMMEKMATGMSHFSAWELAKTVHPQIFERMQKQ